MRSMLHLVRLQILERGKAHGAHPTHVRSLSRVLPQMQSQIVLDLKALCAILARKGFLARMYFDVVFERVLLFELASADVALEGSLARVHPLVLLQIRFPRKLLIAVRALQRLRSVHHGVDLEIAQMLELLRTQLTLELLSISAARTL